MPGGTDLPLEARLRFREALALERGGEPEAALDALGRLCAAYPLRLGLHLYRLRLAKTVHGGRYAARLYEPVPPGVHPERAAFLVKLATLPEEDVAERQGLLEAATAFEPTEPFWRLGLADVRLTAYDIVVGRAERQRSLGEVQAAAESEVEAKRVLEGARQEAETALQHDPKFKEAHVLLGYIHTRRSETETDYEQRDEERNVAMFHYREAKGLDPECVVTRLNLAENLLYFDRYGEAARELKVAVELAPREARAWNNLGVTYYATGRLDQAVTSYRTALELKPDDPRVRTALADCLRRQGKEADAVTELERARGDAGDDKEMLATIAFKLGAIHEHEADYAQAVQEYQTHIDLGGRDAAKAKSRIRHIYEKAYEK